MPSVEAQMNFNTPEEMSPSIVNTPEGELKLMGGFRYEPVRIHDGREDDPKAKLDTQGFQLVEAPTSFNTFDDNEAVRKEYYPVVQEIIKKVTGASRVLVFDHTVRKDKSDTGRFPARHVHVDYTEDSGPARLKKLIGDNDEWEKVLKKRFVQVNVWRSIAGTVERSPLALVEALSVDPQLLVSTKVTFPGKDHEHGIIYGLKNDAEKQRWVYFSSMTQDEVIMIKGYDSKKDVARFTPHSAFDHPHTKSDARPRASIEVRTFALFD